MSAYGFNAVLTLGNGETTTVVAEGEPTADAVASFLRGAEDVFEDEGGVASYEIEPLDRDAWDRARHEQIRRIVGRATS